jgi:hypothetical protein
MTEALIVLCTIIIIPVVAQGVFVLIEQKITRSHYRIPLVKTAWDVNVLAIGLLSGYLFKDLHARIWNQVGFDLFCFAIIYISITGLCKIRLQIHAHQDGIPTSEDVFYSTCLSGQSLLIIMSYVVILLSGGKPL